MKKFIETIYLGDRAVKSIVIDGWQKVVKIQIDCISRIRSQSGDWEFYLDEDIEDGFLVFSGVSFFNIKPDGSIPFDYVLDYKLENFIDEDFSDFILEAGGTDPENSNETTSSIIKIRHKFFWLENSKFEKIEN